MRVPEGRVIYGGHHRAKTCSIIVSGVIKLVNTRPDGRHQIVGLQFPSDFVGRPYCDTSNLFAEAATDLELCSFSGKAFEDLLAVHPGLERALLKRIVKDLDAARDWMFVLGRKSAEEKLASFLTLITDRMGAGGQSVNRDGQHALRLPLSRTEIAECLSLRLETVSRQFAQLKAQGIVETTGRRLFTVRDMIGLRQYSECPASAS
jgi:CRP/FNR family transcriptional regulator